jgi:hypothetical protein
MWLHNNNNPAVAKYRTTAPAKVMPITPAAASNVCPSGLGWEGVTIFDVLQTRASKTHASKTHASKTHAPKTHASRWIIRSNGHCTQDGGAQDGNRDCAWVHRRPARSCDGRGAGGRRQILRLGGGIRALRSMRLANYLEQRSSSLESMPARSLPSLEFGST